MVSFSKIFCRSSGASGWSPKMRTLPSLRYGISQLRNSCAKLVRRQIKRQSPKSYKTNHKITKNAMKKWRKDANFAIRYHILAVHLIWTDLV